MNRAAPGRRLRRREMKDYTKNRRIIDAVIKKLNELDIDLYLIITAEGSNTIRYPLSPRLR